MVVVDDLPQIPAEMVARAARWTELKRWERRELGQALRRLGLSYSEIAEIIPVHNGTLSGWCRDIELTQGQLARLKSKRPALAVRQAVGEHLRKVARARHKAAREKARCELEVLASQPLFVAGVVAYWSEGAKGKEVCFSNSDPSLVRLFLIWAQRYLEADLSRFTVRMHLHSGQDEAERLRYWSEMTCIPPDGFRKTFFKREGTGHRKNILYNGTVQIRMSRSRIELERVVGWIRDR
jgi:hypothetical protein